MRENNHHILIADDEQNIRDILQQILRKDGYQVSVAEDGLIAQSMLENTTFSAVISDLRMPRCGGIELLEFCLEHAASIPFILVTAFATLDSAMKAVRLGAFDYIEKPFEQAHLRSVVQRALRSSELDGLNSIRSDSIRHKPKSDLRGKYGLIGESPEMQRVFDIIEKVADTPSTVLIMGESGTGKELVARALHQHSSRSDGPLIRVNCAAVPKSLIESELFGYEKGAFTGAEQAKAGRFELAHDGTLFLDEIGDVPMEMQVKLLRVLQESEFERVGGVTTRKINVRLTAATNQPLEELIKAGTFREDLFYRLNVVPIRIPALRHRKTDISLLVDFIVDRLRTRLKLQELTVHRDAVEYLQSLTWPGNIRELENVIERAALFCKDGMITVTDCCIDGDVYGAIANNELDDSAGGDQGLTPEVAKTHLNEVGEIGLVRMLKSEKVRLEKKLILSGLEECSWNVTHTAKKLRISRKSLQNKMKDFNLRRDEMKHTPGSAK